MLKKMVKNEIFWAVIIAMLVYCPIILGIVLITTKIGNWGIVLIALTQLSSWPFAEFVCRPFIHQLKKIGVVK